ncbi:hypothetical protein MMC09_006681 [Bachmanniomyces sp. S44760]|nr:hypothetical protein [Bachmanniomyces sp. S44760]
MAEPSSSSLAQRSTTATALRGSSTQTLQGPPLPRSRTVGTLRLRGEPPRERTKIRWAEDVIDNEGLGRKSSKGKPLSLNRHIQQFPRKPLLMPISLGLVCCIYHKTRPVGESSSEDDSNSSSSSGSNSDSELDNGKARPANSGGSGNGHTHNHHNHAHGECSPGSGSPTRPRQTSRGQRMKKKSSPNAYEKIPKGSSTVTVK